MFLSLWRHYPLVLQMIRREVIGRYRGSYLGLLWSFVNPVLMLAVYTFVFSVVFQVRLGEDVSDNRFDFALLLFAGLIVFNLFSECISRAPNLILGHVNYVKKMIFPLEILPWVILGSALFHTAISMLVLLLALMITGHPISWTLLLLPIVLLPLLWLIMGLSWFLASFGVFVRDISQFIGMVLTALLFLSPIFYPASALPESIRHLLFLNPLTFIIEQVRNVVLHGQLPDWEGLGIYCVVAVLITWCGYFWFDKTRKGFADVV